ncbi:MAG: L-seryl-tRNA(Sec) selenium transferase [Alphaproteobacteria bacterium]|jgi:L-seryl-tRNA(Ser) seleniumtransferase|nr:L-seryl-tRNA(Sec) selenium transferase [Alphaproteobacteria bacterium]MDP6567293.1 L-seryl-tRNA(Sec) selenium transferase [Alphaproteobacteria bacterium]MDP6814954.1 L-seryl-tRNA(Sec) selenium transferase [Alphaproteobacteria bacterium]
MPTSQTTSRAAIPSVDRLLQQPALRQLQAHAGRQLVIDEVRGELADLRRRLGAGERLADGSTDEQILCERVERRVAALLQMSLRPVFNLTGTVLHTNLGRAPLAPEALDAMTQVARGASNLEYDLGSGRRGDRDAHVEDWLCRLTGADAATVVNNNAAAVLLLLNTLAQRREVPVSRGELIEIGGSFRLPEIMRRAGCRLVEVGTTNRTHEADFAEAIGPRTAALMKVHTSNYVVQGFTAELDERRLADLAHRHELPMVVDLGAGSLIDLTTLGLPAEPTVRDTLLAGADLVTFSGDKLLGGPQAGLIAGRADLIAKLKRNPMKRALRLDKTTLAALAATLRLYARPEDLAERLPTLRLLSRPVAEIRALAERLQPVLQQAVGDLAAVSIEPCGSQIGSGSLPIETLTSTALVLRPATAKRRTGAALKHLATAFRGLPIPVIGRIADDALHFDLRCLEDEQALTAQLAQLRLG